MTAFSNYAQIWLAQVRYTVMRELMFKSNFILWVLVDLAWFVQFTDGENFPGVGHKVPGTPTATEVLDRYTAAAGTDRDQSETDWFFALGCLKLAAIQAHNRRRHLDGRFHDPYQALLGPSIDRHLSRGLETLA